MIAALLLVCLTTADAAKQELKGHVPAVTKQLAPVGRLESDRTLDLAIGLPLRNRDKLTNLLQELSQPSSPNFRHFLTPEQFASKFGPSQEDYQSVINFAKSHGLTVKKTHSNRTLLDVRGSVSDIEKTFHLNMRLYQHPTEGRRFFAPDAEPTLDLETPVLAISGLDSYVTPRPQLHRPRTLLAPAIRPLGGGGSGGGGGGGGGGGTMNGSGPGGLLMGYDFSTAYAGGLSLDGTGQSVALFELTGYSADDISAYEDEASLPPANLQNIYIDGFDGDDNNPDYALEATADIEMTESMAPGLSSILVYEGPTPMYEAPVETNYVQYSSTTAQINDVLNQMALDDAANQLSCSYQMDVNTSTTQIFEQFAAQGQSFFQGSGDYGGFPGAIDEPSDNPYVTVVGGTSLSTSSTKGTWTGESVWLTPDTAIGYVYYMGSPLESYALPYGASGGGVSLTYGIPTWQQGISMTTNQGSTTMRNLPDVAMVANNIDVVFGNDADGISFDWTEEGTSLATPLWAGFMALVNEQGAANGQPSIGFANPALYAIGKSTNYTNCFHDVKTGNDYSSNSPSRYAAATGYDLCTGWGSPIGSSLLAALLSPPTESLLVTPPAGFASTGPGGGPFTETSQTYSLTNMGAQTLHWSLANTSLWLTVSPTSGTLTPGGAATTVNVHLNTTATNFLIGNPSGNVVFDNLSDGTTQNREFDLFVGNGGFETGDFTDWEFVGDTNLCFALAGDDSDVGGTNALYGTYDWQFVHSGLYGAYLGEWDNSGQSPPNGSLSQTVATTAGGDYLVSFWLTSLASQGMTAPNYFTASWNGSKLFAQTNLNAFGWTNMQYVVPATGGGTVLQFNFNNAPAGFGLDDVSVEPAPAPDLESASMNGGAVMLTWSAVPNLSYQIQASGNLANPNWTNVLGPITATNNPASAPENIGAGPGLFYRVILLPTP